jgi:hypothetical protein
MVSRIGTPIRHKGNLFIILYMLVTMVTFGNIVNWENHFNKIDTQVLKLVENGTFYLCSLAAGQKRCMHASVYVSMLC